MSVSVCVMPATSRMDLVTRSASASLVFTRNTATRSYRPATEYTSAMPGTSPSVSATALIRPRSTLSKTMAVTMRENLRRSFAARQGARVPLRRINRPRQLVVLPDLDPLCPRERRAHHRPRHVGGRDRPIPAQGADEERRHHARDGHSDPLAGAALRALAENERRPEDVYGAIGEPAHRVLDLTLHSAVEDPGARVGAEGADQQELRRAVGQRSAGELVDIGEIHFVERVPRAGLAHGRAEATEHVVGGKDVAEVVQLLIIGEALEEPRVLASQLSTHECDHAAPRGVPKQLVEQAAADEPGGAAEPGGATHLRSSLRPAKPSPRA